MSEMRHSAPGDSVFYELDTIDNKVSSLLTHVSIMMAILAIFYTSLSNDLVMRHIVIIELLLYLIATLGCLRGIFMVGPHARLLEYDAILLDRIKVVSYRFRAYKFSLFLTIVTTVAFMFTLIFHFSGGSDYIIMMLRDFIREVGPHPVNWQWPKGVRWVLKAFALASGAGAAATGWWAAFLWRKASRVTLPPYDPPVASIDDNPALHILSGTVQLNDTVMALEASNSLNSRAARWAAIAAFLTGAATLCGSV